MITTKTFNAAVLRNVNDEQTLFLVDPNRTIFLMCSAFQKRKEG